MSLGPRVVFMRFLDDESPKLTPWTAHATSVLGGRVPSHPPVSATSDEGRSVWQLVSANNRQLARGVGIHSSFDSARQHAELVVESNGRLEIEHVSESGRGVYGWFATLDGVAVMTCARWYMTDRDRRHSSELAARSITAAVLLAGTRLSDPTLMGGRRGAAH